LFILSTNFKNIITRIQHTGKSIICQLSDRYFFGAVLSGRVDNVYGDRNLICTLLSASQVVEEQAAATA
jgi:hypothetical protein